MSTSFESKKEREKQYLAQQRASNIVRISPELSSLLNRREDPQDTRLRLLRIQEFQKTLGTSKELVKKQKKKNKKLKKTTNLRGETARNLREQRRFEQGERRDKPEQEPRIVGDPVAGQEDPEITREKLRLQDLQRQDTTQIENLRLAIEGRKINAVRDQQQQLFRELAGVRAEQQAQFEAERGVFGEAVRNYEARSNQQQAFLEDVNAQQRAERAEILGGDRLERANFGDRLDRLLDLDRADRAQLRRESADERIGESREARQERIQIQEQRTAERRAELDEARAERADAQTERRLTAEEAAERAELERQERIGLRDASAAERQEERAELQRERDLRERLAEADRAELERLRNLPDPVPEDAPLTQRQFRQFTENLDRVGGDFERRLGEHEAFLQAQIDQHTARTGAPRPQVIYADDRGHPEQDRHQSRRLSLPPQVPSEVQQQPPGPITREAADHIRQALDPRFAGGPSGGAQEQGTPGSSPDSSPDSSPRSGPGGSPGPRTAIPPIDPEQLPRAFAEPREGDAERGREAVNRAAGLPPSTDPLLFDFGSGEDEPEDEPESGEEEPPDLPTDFDRPFGPIRGDVDFVEGSIDPRDDPNVAAFVRSPERDQDAELFGSLVGKSDLIAQRPSSESELSESTESSDQSGYGRRAEGKFTGDDLESVSTGSSDQEAREQFERDQFEEELAEQAAEDLRRSVGDGYVQVDEVRDADETREQIIGHSSSGQYGPLVPPPEQTIGTRAADLARRGRDILEVGAGTAARGLSDFGEFVKEATAPKPGSQEFSGGGRLQTAGGVPLFGLGQEIEDDYLDPTAQTNQRQEPTPQAQAAPADSEAKVKVEKYILTPEDRAQAMATLEADQSAAGGYTPLGKKPTHSGSGSRKNRAINRFYNEALADYQASERSRANFQEEESTLRQQSAESLEAARLQREEQEAEQSFFEQLPPERSPRPGELGFVAKQTGGGIGGTSSRELTPKPVVPSPRPPSEVAEAGGQVEEVDDLDESQEVQTQPQGRVDPEILRGSNSLWGDSQIPLADLARRGKRAKSVNQGETGIGYTLTNNTDKILYGIEPGQTRNIIGVEGGSKPKLVLRDDTKSAGKARPSLEVIDTYISSGGLVFKKK